MRRFHESGGKFIADAIYEVDHGIGEPCVIVEPTTDARRKVPARTQFEDLLVPIFRKGKCVFRIPKIHESREHARNQLKCASPEVLKLNNPRRYDVGLESSLHELRSALIARAKQQSR